jgi:hypothetical protein
MLYTAFRVLPYSPAQVWRIIGDIRHFVYKDPFHSDLVFTSDQREGQGVQFTLRHSYWPNFPFRPDTVECLISVSRVEREQVLVETNVQAYRSHTQRFLLEKVEGGTRLVYEIQYMGIPHWLLPWKMWVKWNVLRRMKEKLRDVEEVCGTLAGL